MSQSPSPSLSLTLPPLFPNSLSQQFCSLSSFTPTFIHNFSITICPSLQSCLCLFIPTLHFSLLSLLPQGQPDGHQGAVVSSMEDCRSGAKWSLNGSQTHTSFIDALAWRQLASVRSVCVCVCVEESGADCYVDYTEQPDTFLKAS